VERWVAPARRRIDLGGFIDCVFWHPQHGILGVQCTTSEHAMERLHKILQLSEAALWLAAGGRIQVQAWGRRGKQGKRKLWTLTTEREVTLADFKVPNKEAI
jgi:hypothetical protein